MGVATVVDTEDMVDTVLDTGESTESVRLPLSPRLPLSLTTATEDTVATVVDTVLDTGESTASVRLPLSLTTATEVTVATVVDTEGMVDTEDMVDTVLDTGESTASVRLPLSPTTATEATVVDTVATEATEVTVMATASNMFLGKISLSPQLRSLWHLVAFIKINV